MGQLLSLRHHDTKPTQEVLIDFENAKPTAQEAQVCAEVGRTVDIAKAILEGMKQYKECSELIRVAISSPSPQADANVHEALLPSVKQLKDYHQFATTELPVATRILLKELCTTDPIINLEQKQATAKLLAQVLMFVVDFDDIKMNNPAIQNDFSYYRRTLSKFKQANLKAYENLEVRDEIANSMSMFYASPTPMMSQMTKIVEHESASSPEVNFINLTFATLANICLNVVTNANETSQETQVFSLQVMVASIVLFDLVDSKGAFVKSGDVHIKRCIKAIQSNGIHHTAALLNALRYNTKHLNDAETPKSIRALLTEDSK